jgi:tetratricopeptide (TPR) repeat protein
MPSHIYIRNGDYHLATLANERAIATDNDYFMACHAQSIYPLAYFPHKHHFLAATATLEGAGEKALIAAQNVARYSNKQLMQQAGWGTLQHYYTIPYNIIVKFGKWDDILALENPYPNLPYIQAIRHYARGMAYWGKGNLELAHKELAKLKSISEDDRLAEITIWDINTVQQLTQIASLILEAELMASDGNWEKASTLLTQAIALEDALNYNEPPDWFFSVRHHLGAIQLDAGWFENAVDTYTEDLKRLPKNGWALHGLKAAYRGLKDTGKESQIEEELTQVWAHADIGLNSSRIK